MHFKQIGSLLIAAVIFFAGAFLAYGESETEDKVLVRINGSEIITQAELNTNFLRIAAKYRLQGIKTDESRIEEIKKRLIEDLIDKKLLYIESRKLDITVTDAEIDSEIKKLKSQFRDADDFKKAIENFALTEKRLRNEIKREMAISRFIEKAISQDIDVSAKEVKDFYYENPELFKQPEKIRAAHILVKVDPQSFPRDKALEKIELIKKKLLEGESFESLAIQFSDCPSSASGGDLDFFSQGQMVKPFADAAFALKEGQISDIVETQFGFHLIKQIQRQPKSTIPFREAKGSLFSVLKNKKIDEKTGEYLKNIEKEAVIERLS